MQRSLSINLEAAADTASLQWCVERLSIAYRKASLPADTTTPEIEVWCETPPTHDQWSGIAAVSFPQTDDSFIIVLGLSSEHLLVWGSNVRGVIYGLLELADRLTHPVAGEQPFDFSTPMIRSPRATVRSVSRCFSSEIEDKPWFQDKEGWRQYLDMLVSNRFNRVALTFGMPYNYPYLNGYISDVYFHFAYPFFVAPKGHEVRVKELSESEREDNLEMLQFIGREAQKRELEFQLGLWTHGYDFDDVPNASHTVDGITKENHAPYCRDALHALLQAVPQIRGITVRVHIEGGIAEASYAFWSTVLQGIVKTGRPIEVDLHAKGIEPKLIETALSSGLPVNISPKYMAEHMGLPYHQAAIRKEEDIPEKNVPSAMSFSEGSQRFLRYSYGNLLTRERNYSLSFRIWPGTQRILLWGDPAMAGGFGHMSTISGATGVEICEPLSYKGRMGSGLPGGRFNYTVNAMIPKYDWQKYEVFYRIWGRKLHDNNVEEVEWSRLLTTRCGNAAHAAATALSGIGGVLNIVTQAYGPSACNHSYCPEVYDNLSLINLPGRVPYGFDFKQPGRFGTASSFDPQLFSNPQQLAVEALNDCLSHRYTPLDVATWLDQRADAGMQAVEASRELTDATLPESRRIFTDVEILAGIARFFARKFRAGCAWELYLLTGDPDLFTSAKQLYGDAIYSWKQAADVADQVYQPNLTYGPQTWLQGSWSNRIAAMERDLNDIEAWAVDCRLPLSDDALTRQRVKDLVSDWTTTLSATPNHTQPRDFTPGAAVTLTIRRSIDWNEVPQLHYRHLNQAEGWNQIAMQESKDVFSVTIDGNYTNSNFDLQYYFSVQTDIGICLMPGLRKDLSNQPYFIIGASLDPALDSDGGV